MQDTKHSNMQDTKHSNMQTMPESYVILTKVVSSGRLDIIGHSPFDQFQNWGIQRDHLSPFALCSTGQWTTVHTRFWSGDLTFHTRSTVMTIHKPDLHQYASTSTNRGNQMQHRRQQDVQLLPPTLPVKTEMWFLWIQSVKSNVFRSYYISRQSLLTVPQYFVKYILYKCKTLL